VISPKKKLNPFRNSYDYQEDQQPLDSVLSSTGSADSPGGSASGSRSRGRDIASSSPKKVQDNPMKMVSNPAMRDGAGRDKRTTAGDDGNSAGSSFRDYASNYSADTSIRSHYLEDQPGRQQTIMEGEPTNTIYHLNRMSEMWLIAFLLIHSGQFALLLTVGYKALPNGAFGVVLFLSIAVVLLLLAARINTKKSKLSTKQNMAYNDNICTPEDEADAVSDTAVLCVMAAVVLEGFAFAIFTAVTSGHHEYLSESGFYTKNTLLQVLRFTSITLLALHRVIRPANRLDPLRTVLELELVAVCWDALDGSTLYELLDADLSTRINNAIRVLMAAWYISVGLRMCLMLVTSLSPNHPAQRWVLCGPFQLAPQATVDRTLQGLRLRSIITMSMAAADLFAAFLRSVLWGQGRLDSLQQDMCIKNFLFLGTVAGAYFNYKNTVTKEWNARELIDYPILIKIPRRIVQLAVSRWTFAVSYLLVAGLLTYTLIEVTGHTNYWVANLILDAVLVGLFLLYAKNAYIHEPAHTRTACCIPHSGFFTFPGKMAAIMTLTLGISLLGARLPAAYLHYSSMAAEGSSALYTYDTTMLLVICGLIPMSAFAGFWTISYMLFRGEFTAAPGRYHAIHDPSINMVTSVTLMEGALDVLSAATLMQLAAYDLPPYVDHAIVLFCLLEILNAAMCFALPCLLSGGHDDTPKDLVRNNAYLRMARALIDFGTIVLRTVLWIQYRAVSSVFLIKNLYSLIHTATQVDRYSGVQFYPKGTLFSEYVPAYDWYGLTHEQWRTAIHTERSIAASAAVAGFASAASTLRV